ncbi:hypothetical protein [Streptomyces sp. NPDC048002]|uniref:hypothetical protein n=1 Tax=Streptomyces sp. NPDC048002 TaxID=3154344 RepID=UPI0033D03778
MTRPRQEMDHAVSSLSSSAEHKQAEAVNTLVRIVRGDAARRAQALTALDAFAASHRGRASYRSQPVQDARTVVHSFDAKRAARATAAVEATAVIVLTASSAIGYALDGNVLIRFLVSLGTVAAALAVAGTTRRFWQPYVGAWTMLAPRVRYARALTVLILSVFLERTARSVPGPLTDLLVFGAGTCLMAWLLWIRQPSTRRLR